MTLTSVIAITQGKIKMWLNKEANSWMNGPSLANHSHSNEFQMRGEINAVKKIILVSISTKLSLGALNINEPVCNTLDNTTFVVLKTT